MIFRAVRDGRPYPEHNLTLKQWAEIPPRPLRLDQLITTKRELALDKLLAEDSTFYGDLFPHVVQWNGGLYLEDGLHRALRAALSGRVVSYEGPYYAFQDMVVDPHAVQERVPMWIGGHSERALRRAVTLGDGWAPAPQSFRGPTPELMRLMLDRHDLPDGFDVLRTPGERLDPVTEPGRVGEIIATAEKAGATHINLTVRHESLAHYLEQLEAFAAAAGLDAEA